MGREDVETFDEDDDEAGTELSRRIHKEDKDDQARLQHGRFIDGSL